MVAIHKMHFANHDSLFGRRVTVEYIFFCGLKSSRAAINSQKRTQSALNKMPHTNAISGGDEGGGGAIDRQYERYSPPSRKRRSTTVFMTAAIYDTKYHNLLSDFDSFFICFHSKCTLRLFCVFDSRCARACRLQLTVILCALVAEAVAHHHQLLGYRTLQSAIQTCAQP